MDKNTFSLKIGDTYDLNNRLITNKRNSSISTIIDLAYILLVCALCYGTFWIWGLSTFWSMAYYTEKEMALSRNIYSLFNVYLIFIPAILIALTFFYKSKGRNIHTSIFVNNKDTKIDIPNDYYQRIIIEDLFIQLLQKYNTVEKKKELFSKIRAKFPIFYSLCSLLNHNQQNIQPNLNSKYQYSSHFKSILGLSFVFFSLAGLFLSFCGVLNKEALLPIASIILAFLFFTFRAYYVYRNYQITLYQLDENNIVTHLSDIKYPINLKGIDVLEELLTS